MLKEKLDGGYQYAVDKVLWIHYKELYRPFAQQGLHFKVYGKNHELLVNTDPDGTVLTGNAPAVPIVMGENYLQLNLSGAIRSRTWEMEYYILEVVNMKGESSYLRFRWVESNPSTPR